MPQTTKAETADAQHGQLPAREAAEAWCLGTGGGGGGGVMDTPPLLIMVMVS